MKVKIEVDVSKELYEVGQAVEGSFLKVKEELGKGTSKGQAVVNAISSGLPQWFTAADNFQKGGAEWKEDKMASILAIAVPLLAAFLGTQTKKLE